MRRRFKTPEHQKLYDFWRDSPPAPDRFDVASKTWDGAAFVRGYRFPDKEHYLPGSLARISWAAGVDTRLDDDRKKGRGR